MRWVLLSILFSSMALAAQQFQPAVYYQIGPGKSASQGSATADFNNDGIPDIAAVNQTAGQISILLGNGDGTFQAPKILHVAVNSWAVAAGDLNGDGFADLVVTLNGQAPGSLSVYLGKGDGTFTPKARYTAPSNLHSVVLADFNGDGHVDVAASSAAPNRGSVVVLLGNGDGTLRSTPVYPIHGSPLGVATGDLNGDGLPDLAVADGVQYVDVLVNNGDGTFQTPVQYSAGGGKPQCITIADLNSDGKPDLAACSYPYEIAVFLNNGDGTFTTAPQVSTLGQVATQLVVSDFNLDGKADVAMSGGTGQLFYGKGDGTFGSPISLGLSAGPENSIVSADFNQDGAPDLGVAMGMGNQPREAVLINMQ